MKMFWGKIVTGLMVLASAGVLADGVALEITDETFGCIRDMTPVRGFFVDNLLGDVEATVAAAEAENGAVYPTGSVV